MQMVCVLSSLLDTDKDTPPNASNDQLGQITTASRIYASTNYMQANKLCSINSLLYTPLLFCLSLLSGFSQHNL
jgi:hypothetical protein